MVYLWPAVDAEGEVLDVLVHPCCRISSQGASGPADHREPPTRPPLHRRVNQTPPKWLPTAKVIAATGNYGEIFERTTGKPYQLERGINALWTQGGLMAPMPMK